MDSVSRSSPMSAKASRRDDLDEQTDSADMLASQAEKNPVMFAGPNHDQDRPILHTRPHTLADTILDRQIQKGKLDLRDWTADEICRLPDKSFNHVKNIRVVNLPEHCTKLPEFLGGLTTLTNLNAGDIYANSLNLTSMTALRELRLGHSTALQSLSLGENVKLTTVPSAGNKCIVERYDRDGKLSYSHALPFRLYYKRYSNRKAEFNGVTEFSQLHSKIEESKKVCRDIAPYWLDSQPCLYPPPVRQALKKKFVNTYFGLSDKKSVEDKVLFLHRQRYRDLLKRGGQILVDNDGFGRFLAREFNRIGNDQSAGFLAITEQHVLAMTITKKVVNQVQPIQYIFRLYDPNPTLTHLRMELPSVDAIAAWKLTHLPINHLFNYVPMLTLGRWIGPEALRVVSPDVVKYINMSEFSDEFIKAWLAHILMSGLRSEFFQFVKS